MSTPFPPPLKRFGQNFLIDHNIVRKIVDLAAIRPDETVLEIGPGRGILTRALGAKARRNLFPSLTLPSTPSSANSG